MNLKTILIYILGLICYAGCNQKCEDFDFRIIDWMPHHAGDTFLLKDSLMSYPFTVELAEINHSDKVRNHSKCICANDYTVLVSTNQVEVTIFFNESRTVEQSSVSANGESLMFAEHWDKLDVHGMIYKDVIVYKNMLPSSSAIFEQVILANSIGIVALEGTFGSWLRKDRTLLHVDPSKISYRQFSCV
ncbi:MAG: hypothetical protein AABY93_08250 [Bacteroidota bacterium]